MNNNNLLIWVILLSVLGTLGLVIYLVVEKNKKVEKFSGVSCNNCAEVCANPEICNKQSPFYCCSKGATPENPKCYGKGTPGEECVF